MYGIIKYTSDSELKYCAIYMEQRLHKYLLYTPKKDNIHCSFLLSLHLLLHKEETVCLLLTNIVN